MATQGHRIFHSPDRHPACLQGGGLHHEDGAQGRYLHIYIELVYCVDDGCLPSSGMTQQVIPVCVIANYVLPHNPKYHYLFEIHSVSSFLPYVPQSHIKCLSVRFCFVLGVFLSMGSMSQPTRFLCPNRHISLILSVKIQITTIIVQKYVLCVMNMIEWLTFIQIWRLCGGELNEK